MSASCLLLVLSTLPLGAALGVSIMCLVQINRERPPPPPPEPEDSEPLT